MTTLQALHALKENAEDLQYDIPTFFFLDSDEVLLDYLLDPEREEEGQRRDNEEWQELIKEETDPIEAAALLMDWMADRRRARIEREGEEEREAAGERIRD